MYQKRVYKRWYASKDCIPEDRIKVWQNNKCWCERIMCPVCRWSKEWDRIIMCEGRLMCAGEGCLGIWVMAFRYFVGPTLWHDIELKASCLSS